MTHDHKHDSLDDELPPKFSGAEPAPAPRPVPAPVAPPASARAKLSPGGADVRAADTLINDISKKHLQRRAISARQAQRHALLHITCNAPNLLFASACYQSSNEPGRIVSIERGKLCLKLSADHLIEHCSAHICTARAQIGPRWRWWRNRCRLWCGWQLVIERIMLMIIRHFSSPALSGTHRQ